MQNNILLFFCVFLINCGIQKKLIKSHVCNSSCIEKYDFINNQSRQDSITLFFWSDFDDTVTVTVDNKFSYKKEIKTNPSVDFSLDRIKVPLGNSLRINTRLEYKDDCIEFTIQNKGHNYLNVYTPTNVLKDTSWYLHYEYR